MVGTNYDVIIVGAGSMGMSAGYYLSRQGIKTLLLDAFDPPHESGSHSGDTRLIRHACGDGIEYVPLAIRAQELWDDLQTKTTDTLFQQTGVLNYGPKGSDFIDQAIAGGKQYSLPIEEVSGKEINERWPGNVIPEEYIGCYEPEAGVLFAGNCIRTFRKLALENGATLKSHTPAEKIDVQDDSVKVQTNSGTYTAKQLIISAGAWNKNILSQLGLNLDLQPTRRAVSWFNSDEQLYSPENFPGFFVDSPMGQYYGFPSINGEGMKIGRFGGGHNIDPTYMDRKYAAYPDDEGDVREFLESFMPAAANELNKGTTCMFTNTPDENFVIDLHPEHSHVAIAGGFSGHGFKFSSVIGEILSQLIVSGTTEHDISIFSVTRPSLQVQTDKVYD